MYPHSGLKAIRKKEGRESFQTWMWVKDNANKKETGYGLKDSPWDWMWIGKESVIQSQGTVLSRNLCLSCPTTQIPDEGKKDLDLEGSGEQWR